MPSSEKATVASSTNGSTSRAPQKVVNAPQAAINEFWENLITKQPAKVTRIFPSTLYAHLLPPQRKAGPATGQNAADSYQTAASECRAQVRRVVQECHRTNEKFTDSDFDIGDESSRLCLDGLIYNREKPASSSRASSPSSHSSASSQSTDNRLRPGSTHRIDWIFDDPKFEIDGFESSDVMQGANGDCWFIAAVATICSNPDLIRRVCVDKNEECGVYGFVFCRDGEWVWTVVDDNLYLKYNDFITWGDNYDPTGVKELKFKKDNQTGSEALFFASCANENETWLPLLEKAYAKVHGDYNSIEGGVTGEAIEDLTGGVTTKIPTNRVLSKDRLWKELIRANKDFLFSASSPGGYLGDDSNARQGIALGHAYSIIRAVEEEDQEGKKHKLVLIRNPWGKRQSAGMGEWTGPWSDGSKEWTPYWMEKLNHRFGDDGLFWISYVDLLKRFHQLDRTRLFDSNWSVVQHWTSVSVPWVTGFLNTKFSVEIKQGGPTVFVLCQLDDRYFRGLQGKYEYGLHFILQEAGSSAGEHLVRARRTWCGDRSISAEVDLPPGVYEVLPQIEAKMNPDALDLQRVVIDNAEKAPQKLRQIGLNYDIAHAKGVVELSEEQVKEEEKKLKEMAEKKKKEDEDWAQFEAWKKAKADAKPDAAKSDTPTTPSTAEAADGADTTSGADEPDQTPKGTSTDASTADSAPDASRSDKAPTAPGTNAIPLRPASPTSETGRGRTPTRSSSKSPATAAKGEPATDKEKADKEEKPKPDAEEKKDKETKKAETISDAEPRDVEAKPDAEVQSKQWNAVCVLGLRVYSLDKDVVVKLVKPGSGEGGGLVGNKD